MAIPHAAEMDPLTKDIPVGEPGEGFEGVEDEDVLVSEKSTVAFDERITVFETV